MCIKTASKSLPSPKNKIAQHTINNQCNYEKTHKTCMYCTRETLQRNTCINDALTTCGITNLKQEQNVQKEKQKHMQKYCIIVNNEMKM